MLDSKCVKRGLKTTLAAKFEFMRFLLVGVLLTMSLGLVAQEGKVVMSYDFIMLDDPDDPKVPYQYRTGESTLFTPLYYPEMKKYSVAFMKYLEKMRSVPNYVGPLGIYVPTTLGDKSMKEALDLIQKERLEKVGYLYIPRGTDGSIRFDGTSINLGDGTIQDDRYVMKPDTSYTEDLMTGEMKPVVVTLEEDVYKVLNGAGFTETWHLDKNQSVFEKEVNIISVSRSVFDELTGDYRGQKSVFAFKAGKFHKKNAVESRMVRKGMEYNVLFNYNYHLEDEDDLMSVNSTSDGYIEPSERYEFLIGILAGVKSGQLPAYDYDGIRFDKSNAKRVMPAEFFDRLIMRDTVYVENIENGEMDAVVVEFETLLRDIVGIRFFEDWYMDYENMGMYKRVNGVALLKEKKDPMTGEPLGVMPMNETYIEFRTRW